jgi:hypothetical protein
VQGLLHENVARSERQTHRTRMLEVQLDQVAAGRDDRHNTTIRIPAMVRCSMNSKSPTVLICAICERRLC